MGKKVKKNLVSENVVKKMQRLAGLIDDNEDLEMIKESFDVSSGPSAPTGPSAGPGRSEEVVQEADEEYDMDDDEEDYDMEDDDLGTEDDDLGMDEGEGLDAEEDFSAESDLPVGGGASGGNMEVARALETIAKALGFDVEIDGSSGGDMGMDSPEEPVEGDMMDSPEEPDMGMDNSEFGDDSLDDEQNKMLAEIFAKTSKQIMSKIKTKKK